MIIIIKHDNFIYSEVDNLNMLHYHYKQDIFAFTILIQDNKLYHCQSKNKFYRNINFVMNKMAKYSRFINSQLL